MKYRTLSSLETSCVLVRSSAPMMALSLCQLLMAGHYAPRLQGSRTELPEPPLRCTWLVVPGPNALLML